MSAAPRVFLAKACRRRGMIPAQSARLGFQAPLRLQF